MKKKFFLLTMILGGCFQPLMLCSELDDDIETCDELRNEFDGELDIDTLLAVENLPEDMLKPRQLPWYINVISKPGAYMFFKACNLWDWLKGHSTYMKNRTVNLLYRLHVRRKSA
jgi:hypothetical protein